MPGTPGRRALQDLAVPAGSASRRAVLDDADRLVSEPLVETASEQVVGVKHDEPAASAAGLGFGAGEECVRQPAVAQRCLDPHRLELAVPAPDDGGDARHDATVVVSTEDPELLFLTKSGGGDRGGRHLLLEQRQIGRVGRVLDDEFRQPGRWPGHTRPH